MMSQFVASHQPRCLGCWVNGLILDKSLKYLKIIIYVEVATLMAMVREQIVDILGQFYLNHKGQHNRSRHCTMYTQADISRNNSREQNKLASGEKCLDGGILKLYLHEKSFKRLLG